MMATNTNTSTIIGDNNNENSYDPNPYAYPYFHADRTAPIIYQLIVTHFGSSVEEECPSLGSGSCVGLHGARSSARGVLSTGIQKQCLAHPLEASWADSCGENALHRLCQLVQFSLPERVHGICLPGTTNNRFASNNTVSTKRQRRNVSPAELVLLVQKFMLEADTNVAHAVNNWGETPLLQFLSHCGFASNQNDDVDELNEILDAGTPFKLHFGCRDSDPTPKHTGKRTPPSLQFLNALLEANPDSIFTANYLKVLPLHEACTLSQLSNSPTDSCASMDTFINFSMKENGLNLLRKKEAMRSKGHSLVVERLIEYYPTALMELDNMGRIPLCRAVQSMHCGADIVKVLLGEMELVLKRKNHKESGVVRSSLLRMAIMGDSNPFLETDGMIKGKQSQNMLSPMQELWKIMLTPRRILQPISSEMNSQVACISHIILDQLCPFQRRISINKQAHHETQMREQQIALLLTKQIGQIWEKAIHLILASYRGTVQCTQDPPKKKGIIHAAVFCAVPRCILNMAVRLYPEELIEEDENGDTPLLILLSCHKACGNALGWDNDEGVVERGKCGIKAMDTLQTVLWADPSAAAVANRDGRLPLHLAIDNGIDWSTGIQDLFLANPSAASIRDPVTQLFPFMHASTHDSAVKLDICMQKETPIPEETVPTRIEPDHILTTAYELLRANPANLKM